MVTTLRMRLPRGKRFAVCLTFDFDTFSIWVGAYKRSTPTAVSRGEFGLVGVQRILDLLDRHSARSTWFTPGYDADTNPEVVKGIFERGHEVGHHGYLHETPVNLPLSEEREIIAKGIESIRKVTGRRPEGYRSPAWDLSPNTIGLLLKEGFTYDSSMMGHDYKPYRVRNGDVPGQDGFRFGRSTKLVEIPVYWGLDDFPHFEFMTDRGYGLNAGSGVLENWVNDFDYMYDNLDQGVFNICFHPFVVGRGHRMIVLEKLVEHVEAKEGVWFARAADVARACG